MRFTESHGLQIAQAELDFVDVELDRDTPLFLDPFALRTRSDDFSTRCTHAIATFFQTLIDALAVNQNDEAMRLLADLHEPNETRLGLSRGRPKGSAIGAGLAEDILENLRESEAIKSGLLSDLSDTELFVEGVGPDRISDLATNVLRQELISYTQAQCELHRLPLRRDVAAGPIWDPTLMTWTQAYASLPVVSSRRVLLVPKALVRWRASLTHREYYDHFVINFLQAQELDKAATGLVRIARQTGRVSKKEMKRRHPLSKRMLRAFTAEHPDVLDEYKRQKSGAKPLTNQELEETFDERLFARQLISRLRAIPPGSDHAFDYHTLMVGVLEFVFYPNLIYPKREREINEGRKRIDISYTNHATSGLFERFPRTTRLPANEIMVECKNYTRDVANPELDQLTGRFADHRGWLGLLVSRQIDSREALIARCRDSARDRHGYAVPLDDRDVVIMLEAIERGDREHVIHHLDMVFRPLTA